jgi:hypothetical protein
MPDSVVDWSSIAAVVQRLEVLRCQITSPPPPGWGKRGVTVSIATDGVRIAEKSPPSSGGWTGCHIDAAQIAMVAAKRDPTRGRYAAVLGLLVNGEILHLEIKRAGRLVDALAQSPLASRVGSWDDLEDAYIDALDEDAETDDEPHGAEADAVVAGILARSRRSRRRIAASLAVTAASIVLLVVGALIGSGAVIGAGGAIWFLTLAYLQLHILRTNRRIKRLEAQEEAQLDARPH